MTTHRRATGDENWDHWANSWRIRPGTVYLNHGSFGPAPISVREAQHRWHEELQSQPMDFFVRQYEPAWLAARESLAKFVGAAPENLIFAENATAAMNLVAANFPLKPDTEVLLTDHEYKAVERIWRRACLRAGCDPPRIVTLPSPIQSAEEVVATLFAATTSRTRLLIVSHITSPTAITFPVHAICLEARRRGIAVCLDGPHALGQLPLTLDALACDFYAASGHKWLSAPFGSGFLYVSPQHQPRMHPLELSWGRIPPAQPDQWWEEFIWPGTRDPSAFLTMPAAIEFLEQVGFDAARGRMHELAQYARHRLVELTRLEPLIPDSPEWYGSMAHVPLPPGDARSLQDQLWRQYGIEIPVIEWNQQRWIRVSCHLYNRRADVDHLLQALSSLL